MKKLMKINPFIQKGLIVVASPCPQWRGGLRESIHQVSEKVNPADPFDSKTGH